MKKKKSNLVDLEISVKTKNKLRLMKRYRAESYDSVLTGLMVKVVSLRNL
ncbi:MAG: hypothetical protein WC471_02360 [Candidatus Woesearchaeota archaeon]